MAFEMISTEQVDRVAIVTLNRPEVLNALSLKLVREVDEYLTEAEADDGIGAVIITGAGERAFSAGADIHENREFTQEQRDAARCRAGPIHLAPCRQQQARSSARSTVSATGAGRSWPPASTS